MKLACGSAHTTHTGNEVTADLLLPLFHFRDQVSADVKGSADGACNQGRPPHHKGQAATAADNMQGPEGNIGSSFRAVLESQLLE